MSHLQLKTNWDRCSYIIYILYLNILMFLKHQICIQVLLVWFATALIYFKRISTVKQTRGEMNYYMGRRRWKKTVGRGEQRGTQHAGHSLGLSAFDVPHKGTPCCCCFYTCTLTPHFCQRNPWRAKSGTKQKKREKIKFTCWNMARGELERVGFF